MYFFCGVADVPSSRDLRAYGVVGASFSLLLYNMQTKRILMIM
jgi:hypothetical protein